MLVVINDKYYLIRRKNINRIKEKYSGIMTDITKIYIIFQSYEQLIVI